VATTCGSDEIKNRLRKILDEKTAKKTRKNLSGAKKNSYKKKEKMRKNLAKKQQKKDEKNPYFILYLYSLLL